MTKTIFKVLTTAAIAVLCLGACCGGKKCQAPQFTGTLPVGLQLYSVRTDLEADFYGTLKAVREMGYEGVEFCSEYYGNDVVQVKRWCTELGLIPFSNHVPFQRLIDDVEGVIKENTILGTQYIVFPYMDEASRPGVDPDQFKATVAKLGEVGAKVREAGFQLLYHNHDFEFVNLPDGSVGYYYIFDSNKRENLQYELDVCWANYAEYNPVAIMQRYSGNIPVIHLKDYKLEGHLSKPPYALIGISNDNTMKDEGGSFEFRSVGCGQVDVNACIQAAINAKSQWICVEQDEPTPGETRLEGVRRSAKYLHEAGLL
mgnify:CR=1 FL=1